MIEGILLIALAIPAGLVLQGIDRKLTARMQNRIGPPILQPYYDFMKLIQKRDIIPDNVGVFFTIFPILTLVASLCVLPFLSLISFKGDIIVTLYLLLMISAFLALSGFASGSPFGTIGAWREIMMVIGYELPLVVAVVAVIMDAGSLSLSQIASSAHFLPFAFAAFLISTQAKLARSPFHIPDAETEIVAGIHTEYSGVRLAMLNLSAAVDLFIMVVLAVMLFLSPPTWYYFAGYSLAILFVLTTVKVITGRLRIDQMIRFFWFIVGPIALIDLLRVLFLAA
ncbi:MAG: complex I subunit 1 family protein [archaeon]